ncbi:cytochrome-c oxidase [Bacillus timonensis]|uniref:Cytochrome-c oxidase n=1 Tax=Bacillus timonensis TaxID=1033734 RepID=A0A4S3PLD2_9BACI|nr:cytochrome-c oxidase [Bacillus timonensis]THE10297.1 cytochrome-c oxidase [Bacillus timonensis]
MVGIRFLKMAALYFVIGVLIGMGMSMSHSYTLTGVHVHINLLGWASMGLAGIVYYLFPQAGESKLGKIHFWLHNIGLPVMMIGLTMLLLGNPAVEPAIAVGGTVTTLAIILFAINIFLNVKVTKQ